MSVSLRVGLAGVSVRMSRVAPRTPASTAAGSEVSANVNSTPKRARTCRHRRRVPPKITSETTAWSPALRNASRTAWIAAMPVPNAQPSTPPSRAASFVSSARTVGLCDRE